MKRTIRFLTLLIGVLVMATLTGCVGCSGCGSSKKELSAELEEVQSQNNKLRSKVEELESEVSKLELENSSLKQQADASANETFLALSFPQDGRFYEVRDENFKFYSDQACENSLGNDVRIISPVVEEKTRPNGFTICVCLSDQGLVYSTYWPDLVVQPQN